MLGYPENFGFPISHENRSVYNPMRGNHFWLHLEWSVFIWAMSFFCCCQNRIYFLPLTTPLWIDLGIKLRRMNEYCRKSCHTMYVDYSHMCRSYVCLFLCGVDFMNTMGFMFTQSYWKIYRSEPVHRSTSTEWSKFNGEKPSSTSNVYCVDTFSDNFRWHIFRLLLRQQKTLSSQRRKQLLLTKIYLMSFHFFSGWFLSVE